MAHDNNHRIERYIRYTLLVLTILLVLLVVFFVVEYRALRRAQIIDGHEAHFSQLLERHAPLAPTESGDIRSWMTFDYVNKLFALPPDYLKSQLSITNAHYPRLTIGSSLLNQVEAAVAGYVAPKNSTSTKSASA